MVKSDPRCQVVKVMKACVFLAMRLYLHNTHKPGWRNAIRSLCSCMRIRKPKGLLGSESINSAKGRGRLRNIGLTLAVHEGKELIPHDGLLLHQELRQTMKLVSVIF